MRALAVLLTLTLSVAARAEGPLDPNDTKWHPESSQPGRMTLQGHDADEEPPAGGPLVPEFVRIPVTLAVAAGGFVLVIPQLSISHVFGFKPHFDRTLAWSGLGLLALAAPVGLGLSGGGVGTMIVAPLIEAGLVGAAWGLAYLTDKSLSAGSNTVTQVLFGYFLGWPLLGITVPVIAAAALYPIACAFIPGWELDAEQDRAPSRPTQIGLVPVRGGGLLAATWALP